MAEIIVPLDVPTSDDMTRVMDTLDGAIEFYKVGLELFVAEGPSAVAMVTGRGKRVFLDLKLHDIPRTVANAITSAGRLGVDLLTIHAHGGQAMMEAAAEAAGALGDSAPRLLAVTTLTSLDQSDLARLGVARSVADHTAGLAELAHGCGIDGLVCSPHEAANLRALVGPDMLLVTPGVRPAGADVGDQKRVATPADAVRAGANYLVIGRPIVQADDPAAAAEAIQAEMAAAG